MKSIILDPKFYHNKWIKLLHMEQMCGQWTNFFFVFVLFICFPNTVPLEKDFN